MNSLKLEQAKRDFWWFFLSTLLSIIGMDFYLFTHGWFLRELGTGHMSIGVSWSIFFTPGLILLLYTSHFIKKYEIRSILLFFESAKTIAFFLLTLILYLHPSAPVIYLMSALLGFLFAPFYPVTYSLLKDLFRNEAVVRYSNIFEVSFQLAGALAILSSGFVYEKLNFYGIMMCASACILLSNFCLFKISNFQNKSPIKLKAFLEPQISLPKFSEIKFDRIFFIGLLHQIPQNVILLSNITTLIYVERKMHGGPSEFGYLDGLYSIIALVVSLLWSKLNSKSPKSMFLIANLMGAFSFVAYSYLPSTGILPFAYISLLALSMTVSKMISRSIYIQSAHEDFLQKYTSLFQITSNLTLVFSAFLLGIIIDKYSLVSGLMALASVMIIYSLTVALLKR